MPSIGFRCAPSALKQEPTLTTLARIVRHYRDTYRPDAEQELGDFRNARSLADALNRAGMAINSQGDKFPHQWRIKLDALPQATQALIAATHRIRACDTFDSLIHIVSSTAGQVTGIGELYVYDTSFRIGSYLGLYPGTVYLHAGTRAGARFLNLGVRRPSIPMNEFPPELRRLRAWEIEDILCIYKNKFKLMHSRQNAPFFENRGR
jgi:hypothetical protein